MGAARLRIASFPTVSTDQNANAWAVTPIPRPASASFVNNGDTLAALSDNLRPKASNDTEIPRFTWWEHKGTTEWVQYDFEKPTRVQRVAVYWFDDSPGGGCRVPASWQVLYKAGDEWKPVSGAGTYGVRLNRFNGVAFEAVETTGLRLEVKLQEGFSGGVLEWRVE
jgi:hypothetical protein